MCDPTNFTDELNRKTFESLMDAAKRYQDGHIDENAYKAAVEAIYGVVAGLVSTQVAETVDEAVNAVSKYLESKTFCMFLNGKYTSLTWFVGSSELIFEDAEGHCKKISCGNPEQARKKWSEYKKAGIAKNLIIFKTMIGDEL